MSIFDELKRRNVFRVGVAYAVAAWVLLEVADWVLDNIGAPEWIIQVMMLVVVLGFIAALIIAWAYELTPEGIKLERDVERGESVTHTTGQKLDRIIIGFLAVALAYFVVDKFVFSAKQEASPPGHAEVSTDTRSIAVLPFVNMSSDPEQVYFSDGISEEILNALAKVPDVKVAGRTSSFAFKGRNEDLRVIGETLGVKHILEGSVRKAGNTVRITAQLVQVSDGFHLWSDTYDRELTDIFAIQDEISGAILEALKAELIGGEQILSTRTDSTAYDKYLLAKQRFYGRNTAEMQFAVELLDEALDLDPDFAPAWALRGIVTLELSDQKYGLIPIAEARKQSGQNIERALEIDDGVAEAWAGLGLLYFLSTSTEEAVQAIEPLERALQLNPSMIDASNWLMSALSRAGRDREARSILEDMHERDPLYPPGLGNLVLSYLKTGELDKARAVLDRVRQFTRDEPIFVEAEAMVRIQAGEYAEALPFAQFAVERAPQNQNSLFRLGLVLMRLNEYEPILDLEMSRPFQRMTALRLLGRTEEATMLARDYAGTDPMALFNMMVIAGQYEAAVEMLENRWPDLEAFDAFYGGNFGFGNYNMLLLAKAYLETGNTARFDQAMRMVRDEHDRQLAEGAGSPDFRVVEAKYWTMANDHEKAIDYLELAVAQGWSGSPRLSDTNILLKPLEGDPRYEAVQAQALERLNRERTETGLSALEPGYTP